MISGIYKLTFPSGSTYIGQSLDISKRYEEHKTNLLRGKASVKMQLAYKNSGMPNMLVMLECHRDNLDLLEAYYILKLKPDLNTTIPIKNMSAQDMQIIEDNILVFRLGILELISRADALYTELDVYTAKYKTLEYDVINIQNELVSLANMTTDERLKAALNDIEALKSHYDEVIASKNANIEALTPKVKTPWYKRLIFWNG